MAACGYSLEFQNHQLKRRQSAELVFDSHAMLFQRDLAGYPTKTDRALPPTRRVTRTTFPKPTLGRRRDTPLRRCTAILLLHLASLFLALSVFQCSRNRGHTPPSIDRI